MDEGLLAEIEADALGWRLLWGEHLHELLCRAFAGETPDDLFIEVWQNGENVESDD